MLYYYLQRSLWSVAGGYTGFREGGVLSAKLCGQKKLAAIGKLLLEMLHSGITWTLKEWSSSQDTAIRCLAVGFGRNSLLTHGEREALLSDTAIKCLAVGFRRNSPLSVTERKAWLSDTEGAVGVAIRN